VVGLVGTPVVGASEGARVVGDVGADEVGVDEGADDTHVICAPMDAGVPPLQPEGAGVTESKVME